MTEVAGPGNSRCSGGCSTARRDEEGRHQWGPPLRGRTPRTRWSPSFDAGSRSPLTVEPTHHLGKARTDLYAKPAMRVDVVNSVVINRAVTDVSQYAADPDNAPLWYENIKSVEWKTPRPVQMGSQIDFVAHFLGRRLAYTYEIVEFVPGRRLTMRTAGPPSTVETTYTWESENGATRMTLRNRGTPSGFSAWFAPVMSLMIGRANRKDLALLKRRLEENG